MSKSYLCTEYKIGVAFMAFLWALFLYCSMPFHKDGRTIHDILVGNEAVIEQPQAHSQCNQPSTRIAPFYR